MAQGKIMSSAVEKAEAAEPDEIVKFVVRFEDAALLASAKSCRTAINCQTVVPSPHCPKHNRREQHPNGHSSGHQEPGLIDLKATASRFFSFEGSNNLVH